MPQLKFSTIFTFKWINDGKVEVKQTTEAGNLKVENKVNVNGTSAETKLTLQNVKLAEAPVDISLSKGTSSTLKLGGYQPKDLFGNPVQGKGFFYNKIRS